MKRTASLFLALLMMVLCALPAAANVSPEMVIYAGPEQVHYDSPETDTLSAAGVDVSALKQFLASQMAACASSIDVERYNIPVSCVEELFDLIRYDIPECFHFSDANYGTYENGKTVLSIVNIKYCSFADTQAKYKTAFAAIKTNAQKIGYGIIGNKGLNQLETALLLHDRLALWNRYDHINYINKTVPQESYSMYGALVLGTSVCEGYAKAYSYLLSLSGIDSYFCPSKKLSHAWNIVYIDGVPYHVDVTNDDGLVDISGRVSHKYFLISTAELKRTRNLSSVDFDQTPTSTKYDNRYWRENVESAVIKLGSKFYCIDGKNEDLATLNIRTGEVKKVLDTDDEWYASEDSFWPGCYSRIASDGNVIFYNTASAVFAYDPETGTSKQVFTPKKEGPYYAVYGLAFKDGIIYCDTFNSPNFEVDTIAKHQKSTKYVPGEETPDNGSSSGNTGTTGKTGDGTGTGTGSGSGAGSGSGVTGADSGTPVSSDVTGSAADPSPGQDDADEGIESYQEDSDVIPGDEEMYVSDEDSGDAQTVTIGASQPSGGKSGGKGIIVVVVIIIAGGGFAASRIIRKRKASKPAVYEDDDYDDEEDDDDYDDYDEDDDY